MKAQEARSPQESIEALHGGECAKYLCFWGHYPLPDGEIGKRCLPP
jgi:hypothetical protein